MFWKLGHITKLKIERYGQGAYSKNTLLIFKSICAVSLLPHNLKNNRKYISNRTDGQSVHLTVNEFELMVRSKEKKRNKKNLNRNFE